MNNLHFYLATILIFITKITIIEAQLSPCPRLFRYLPRNPNEPDKWYGEILVQSEVELIDGVFVVLIFDKPSIQLGSSFGQQILKRNEKEYLLRNLGYRLDANTPLVIKFFVKYNQFEEPPKFVGFRVNARPICPEGGLKFQDEFITSKPTLSVDNSDGEEFKLDMRDHPDIPKPSPSNTNADTRSGVPDEPNKVAEQNPVVSQENVKCGTVPAMPVGLIANGLESVPGEWPWHIALVKFEGAQSSYICGGTLISKRHVLTAAHCVTHRPTNSILSPESLAVFLGKHNLRYVTQMDQQRDVTEIYVHPEFSETGLKNDIAILKLASPVQYNNYVRPVCLWKENPSLEAVIHRKGTVIGWGLDEHKKISPILRKVDIPVIPTTDCIYSNINFFSNVVWQKNYCAGYTNATSICNGDSGGGMFFPVKGTSGPNTIWQMRGLVSIGVGNQGYRSVCDSKEYTVFTDVAQYLSWIEKILQKP